MSTAADSQEHYLDLSKLNLDDIKVLKELYSFLLQRKNKSIGDTKKIKKLPNVFYQPTKVDSYQAFERDVIYEKK
jgi:hypothetical protein